MKKFLSILLAVLLIVSASGIAFADGSGSGGVIVVPENSFKPLLNIVSGTKIPELKAGGKVTLKLPIKNNSPHNAKDVVIALSAAEGSSFPFVIDKLNTSVKVDKIESYTTYDAVFELELDEFVKPGQYILKVDYSYSNTLNNSFNSSEIIAVNIVNENTPPKLTVNRVGLSKDYVLPGESINVTFRIKNLGTLTAKDIKLTVQGLRGDGFTAEGLTDVKHINELEGNKETTITYRLNASKSISEGNHSLNVNIDYKDSKGTTYTESSQFFVPVGKVYEGKPSLKMENISYPEETLRPGSDFNIALDIVNTGDAAAYNIKVSLVTGSEIINKSLNTVLIDTLDKGKSQRVNFKMNVIPDAITKNYPIGINVEYDMGQGDKAVKNSLSQYVGVYVEEHKGKSNIKMDNIEYPRDTLSPGSNFNIGLDVVNAGDTDAYNIKVSLITGPEIINKSLNTVLIDTLEKGKSQRVDFKMNVLSEAATKNYPIGITVEYETGQGSKAEKNSLTQYVGVYVEKDEEKKTVPKIIVDSYSFEPSEIVAGEDFKLNMSFFNTNRTEPVSNIKVTVSSDDGTFNPVNSSTTFYIENIDPKGSVSKEMILNAKPDAAPKTYNLSVNMEYEDSKGNQYTAKDTIGVIVQQVPKLVAGEVEMSPEAFVGQPTPVYVEFYNMGKSTLYNLMVTAEGDFQVQGSGYYVGNFEPGKSDSFDVTVLPNAPGAVTGSIVFKFEDSSGKPMEVRKEFSMNVMEMPTFDDPGIMIPGNEIPEQKSKTDIKKIALIAGSAVMGVIVLVIVVIVTRRKIKARKELMLDE